MIKQFLLATIFCLLITISKAQYFSGSNLPIIIINTHKNQNTGLPIEIQDEPKVLAYMKIIFRPDGSRNLVTDQNNPDYLNYDGQIGIEIRGSSSQNLPKKPYGLSTLKEDNVTNNNVSILGMPEEHDWILNSLAYDPSLIRNYLSYDLSRSMGNYAARGKYCEVVINGDYKGLYIFMEKLKIDRDRINIVKMTNTDNVIPELTGGYVIKADKTTGGDPIAWTMASYNGSTNYLNDSPDPWEITSQQKTFIKNEFTRLQTAATAQNTSIHNGFPSIIDIPSFVDFMLINELASNADAYQYSTYFHKDRDGKLRAGPAWDFDLTYGNDLFLWGFDRSHTDVWQFITGNAGSKFWRDLFNNPTFNCYLARRWKTLNNTNGPLNYFTIAEKMDQLANQISEAMVRENQRWGTIPNHGSEIANMKEWLQARINWLNTKLSKSDACSNPYIPKLVISKINYNPIPEGEFKSDDLEFIEISNHTNQVVNLTGVYFCQLGISYQFPANSNIKSGEKIILAGNSSAFEQFYGVIPFGQFTRNLSNKSELIVLADAFGNVIDSVRYTDENPWPVEADGNGYFLELTDENSDNGLAVNWTFSSNLSVGVDDDKQFTGSINVYPNPARTKIAIDAKQNQIYSYEICDLSGRKMKSGNGINSNHFLIDVIDLLPGIYIIKLGCYNDATFVQKFIKK